jgi:outer membrane protein assembly factor BamB
VKFLGCSAPSKQSLSLIIALLLLNACSLFTPKEKPIPPAPLPEFAASANLKVLWQSSAGSADSYVFSPAIDGNDLYVASRNELTRFDIKSGKQTLRIETEQKLSGGVGADREHILAATSKGEVLAYDNEGKRLWRSQVSSEILSAPQISGDIVVVRTVDNRIYGLNSRNGERKWMYQSSNPNLIIRTHNGIILTRGAVFAGLPGGKLVGIDLLNGKSGWEANVASPRGATELERISDVTSLPVIDERQICAVAYQGRVACFDLQQGSPLWTREISSYSGLIMDDRYLYISDVKGNVVAVDKTNGKEVWKQDKLHGRSLSAPQLIDRYLAVGDFEGYVHILNRKDGNFVTRSPTDGSQIIAQPEKLDNKIFIQTKAGGIFALAIE